MSKLQKIVELVKPKKYKPLSTEEKLETLLRDHPQESEIFLNDFYKSKYPQEKSPQYFIHFSIGVPIHKFYKEYRHNCFVKNFIEFLNDVSKFGIDLDDIEDCIVDKRSLYGEYDETLSNCHYESNQVHIIGDKRYTVSTYSHTSHKLQMIINVCNKFNINYGLLGFDLKNKEYE